MIDCKLIQLIIMFLISPLFHVTLQDCILEEFPLTRTFSTLDEYQQSRISFNPRHYGYEGNVVAFQMQKLEVIPKNSFISFGSEGIVELHLENKQINRLDRGAFLGLGCLNELNLSNNSISDLSEGVFEGLENLNTLLLSNNFLVCTPDSGMAFLHLINLKTLDLSRNRIKVLHRIAFDSLVNLQELKLDHNLIRTIDDAVFNPLVNLDILLLNNNYLTTINAQRWQNLGKLSVLNLANNYLTSFDTGYDFSFTNLTTLDLSGNSLTVLDGIEIKRWFKELNQLDVKNNPWMCTRLNELKESLIGSNIDLPGGIECSDNQVNKWVAPTPPREESTSTAKYANAIPDSAANVSAQLQDQFIENNKVLNDKVEYIQHFLTFITVIIIGTFLVVLLVKLQVCQVIASSIYQRPTDFMYQNYTMPNSPETYRLIGR